MKTHKSKLFNCFTMMLLLVTIIGIGIGAFFLYVGPLRNWDAEACAQRVNTRLGTEPNLGAVYRYVNRYLNENLYPGMDRDNVIRKIKEIGPIKIDSISVFDGYRDTIWVKYCYLPINYIHIEIWYDFDKRLTDFGLDTDL